MTSCPACMAQLPGAFGGEYRKFCDRECRELFASQQRGEPFFAMSHEDIGTELGISRQAVAKIEKNALRKFRKGMRLKWGVTA